MIYFIRQPQTDMLPPLIKIGTTTHLGRRLYGLCREHNADLTVMGIVDGNRAEEQELHRHFAEFRVAGEWFAPEPALLDYIDRHARPWNPEVDEEIQIIATLRGSEEMRLWIRELVRHTESCSPAHLIRRALAHFAAESGFSPPPEYIDARRRSTMMKR